MFPIYTLLFTLGVFLTAPYYLWRLRGRISRLADWRERLGYLPESFQQSARGAVWIHAVSVGETLAVENLIKGIRENFPEVKIFLSHTTPAGRETSETRLRDVAGRFYLPLDWPWAVRRVLARILPSTLLIVETELWPNLIRAAHEHGAHVGLANARLSARSFRRYRLFLRFMRRVFAHVDWIGAQTAADAERFFDLGVRPERVNVTGNLKFDSRPPEHSALGASLRRALEAADRKPVLVAASTMPKEEEKVLKAWEEIRSAYPKALLILAPRHPARFETVALILAKGGWKFVRRSGIESESAELTRQVAQADVLLLNSVGELANLFELADVVFVGGSLVPAGGHNLLEPAYWSKPILFGPRMENFRDAAEIFVKAGGAFVVHNEHALALKALELFGDTKLRYVTGQVAKQALEAGSGGTHRALTRLREWLEADKAGRGITPAGVRGDSRGLARAPTPRDSGRSNAT